MFREGHLTVGDSCNESFPYLGCSCYVARCQQGNWYFLGLNGCSHPELGTRWEFLCVWAPTLEAAL